MLTRHDDAIGLGDEAVVELARQCGTDHAAPRTLRIPVLDRTPGQQVIDLLIRMPSADQCEMFLAFHTLSVEEWHRMMKSAAHAAATAADADAVVMRNRIAGVKAALTGGAL